MIMDYSVLFGIGGIIVTVVISFLIYSLQRIKRYPGQLSFSVRDLMKVMGDVPRNYEELSLKLGDYEIKDNLLFVELLLFNDQTFDCSCNNIETPLLLELPSGMKWVDVNVRTQSEGVNAVCKNSQSDSQIASLTFELLRKNEYIVIEGLLESAKSTSKTDLLEKITLSHRIPNVAPIKKKAILSPSEMTNIKKRVRVPIAAWALVILIIPLRLLFGGQYSLLQFVDNRTGEVQTVCLNKNNELVLARDSFFRPWRPNSISQDVFTQHFSPVFERNRIPKEEVMMCIMLAFFSLLFLLMIIDNLLLIRRTRIIERVFESKPTNISLNNPK